jgi:hypothetical protein
MTEELFSVSGINEGALLRADQKTKRGGLI